MVQDRAGKDNTGQSRIDHRMTSWDRQAQCRRWKDRTEQLMRTWDETEPVQDGTRQKNIGQGK